MGLNGGCLLPLGHPTSPEQELWQEGGGVSALHATSERPWPEAQTRGGEEGPGHKGRPHAPFLHLLNWPGSLPQMLGVADQASCSRTPGQTTAPSLCRFRSQGLSRAACSPNTLIPLFGEGAPGHTGQTGLIGPPRNNLDLKRPLARNNGAP